MSEDYMEESDEERFMAEVEAEEDDLPDEIDEEDRPKMYALVDGDVVAYHACPYDRSAISGQNGRMVNGVRVYSEEEDNAYLSICFENAISTLRKLAEVTYADEVKCFVKGEGNFRDEMYEGYKNRDKSNTAVSTLGESVPIVRALLVDAGEAEFAHGAEADDYLRIWAEELKKNGDNFVICSIDKDLKCIAGRHYHLKHKHFFEVSEEEAMRFYYAQLMAGDPTDKIPGIPKIGMKTAEKMLAEAETEEEMQFLVCNAYQSAYQGGWLDALNFNGKLIHIKKTETDIFDAELWFESSAFLKEVVTVNVFAPGGKKK